MKLLLDTNVFIWCSVQPDRLSESAKRAVTDPRNDRFVSIASVWEMQIKHALGKLPLPGSADHIAKEWLRSLAARTLPIELRHLGELYTMTQIHRDPFDRVLIAQALSDDLTIVSADAVFSRYRAPVIW